MAGEARKVRNAIRGKEGRGSTEARGSGPAVPQGTGGRSVVPDGWDQGGGLGYQARNAVRVKEGKGQMWRNEKPGGRLPSTI